MRKQMARQPIEDADIINNLVWVQEMINAIIVGPKEGTPEIVPPLPDSMFPDGVPLSDEEQRVLDALNDARAEIMPTFTDAPLADDGGHE